MNAIKLARNFIATDPTSEAARTLAALVLALESAGPFELSSLYRLDYKRFQLAIDILEEWRIDRYYAGKAKLFDLSLQVSELPPPAPAAAPAPAPAPAAAPAPVPDKK
ncbi:hypothetical protein PY257_05020 [Ramlibacter sp. H39-3-26]|uniref:hypothetical protein n=1 Tax=Curvibacter soli TaxID=3031331 RepID=UPI0023DB0544|nr:hypothetical protein [Ramlibacter sp. H39-3-26]MDF1484548.1 hypothetical protein [Ramlibacter sp. H39-3-26]